MKRAQDVAQAVVRSRSTLSSWSCMGARRRSVGPVLNSKDDDKDDSVILERTSESIVTETVTRDAAQTAERSSLSSQSGHDDTDEEEHLLGRDRMTNNTTMEDVTEGDLWYELEKELERQEQEVDSQIQAEEAAAAKEIIEEENVLAEAAEKSQQPLSTSDVVENHHFYPPGRIMHIVSVPSPDMSNIENEGYTEEHVGLFETPRELYSKIRLSRTMINDHYMPMYKKMIELLIRKLEKDEAL